MRYSVFSSPDLLNEEQHSVHQTSGSVHLLVLSVAFVRLRQLRKEIEVEYVRTLHAGFTRLGGNPTGSPP